MRGEMHVNALDLATLAALADHLPLAHEVRKQLAEFSPKGGINDMVARWTGEWREPKQYSVRGRFRNLALLNRAGRIPGFTGVSGAIEATERGGTLSLNSNKATVEMPLVFREQHEFEALAAQVSWTRSGGDTELKLNSISFSNSHLAGTVFGTYRTAGSARGVIDITGSLTRADARFVSRYIPLVIGLTFLCGLLPIVGNLISNSVIVGIAFTESGRSAIAALVFLILLHKLEYFLNSKIIGYRIKNPMWLTLLALVVGERTMGIPGMILAPVVLDYVKVETSRLPPPD